MPNLHAIRLNAEINRINGVTPRVQARVQERLNNAAVLLSTAKRALDKTQVRMVDAWDMPVCTVNINFAECPDIRQIK
jgi:hypothetical protein